MDVYLSSRSRPNIFSSSNESKRSITNLLEFGLLYCSTYSLGVSQESILICHRRVKGAIWRILSPTES